MTGIYEGTLEQNEHGGLIVLIDGEPLAPRNDLRNHSPCGFQWGYGGSGPAQLALAILAHLLEDDERALSLYQDFKWKVIAKLPIDEPWKLGDGNILGAVWDIEHDNRQEREMKKVTPNNCKKIIEGMERLKLAGVEIKSDIELGPPVVLRRIFRDDGRITWEILPQSIADLTLQGIPENEPGVARARIFRTPPKEAPMKIVTEWTYRSGLRRRRLGEDSTPSPSN